MSGRSKREAADGQTQRSIERLKNFDGSDEFMADGWNWWLREEEWRKREKVIKKKERVNLGEGNKGKW